MRNGVQACSCLRNFLRYGPSRYLSPSLVLAQMGNNGLQARQFHTRVPS